MDLKNVRPQVVEVVDIWTGRHANALRQALRLTNEGFAAELGTAVRTVAKWNAEPDLVPVTELQRALDTALSQAPEEARIRFSSLVTVKRNEDTRGERTISAISALPEPRNPFAASAALKLDHDPLVAELLDWLDDHAEWPDGEAESRVRDHLASFDMRRLKSQARKRSRVRRQDIAEALMAFYEESQSDSILYRATVNGRPVQTSIVTQPSWLQLGLALGQGNDQLSLTTDEDWHDLKVDDTPANAAAARIAEALATDTRIINKPLYQLRHLDLSRAGLTGSVSLTTFTDYALTLDLLERETLDALVSGRTIRPGTLPLRDYYLPNLPAITQIDRRLCAGGPLALFAAARPGSRSRRGEADYVLLVQQRSNRVLNSAGRLAVIPKSFHEPLVDFSDDAQISATLERELEEELFGRTDVDTTVNERRHADPLHLSQLSEPMRWLIDNKDPDRWRMECTGFGFNLVSGNFEFASLVVVEDEDWWDQFGGHVEANWETEGLRRYSTRDRDTLANLVHDGSWSNEGLFAFIQGLIRLSEIGGSRTSVPPMTLEM